MTEMQTSLSGKTAIITGASSGIGRAAAARFAAAGARVVLADVNASAGEDAAREGIAAGGQCVFVRTDVSSEEEVSRLVETAIGLYGGIHIFIHAAGILEGAFQPIEELSLDTWNRVLAVNLTGTFLCARQAAAHLTRSRGVFLCFASVAGVRQKSSSFAYGASKGGVNGLMMTIEPYFASRGIRARVICPSAVDTPMKRQNVVDAAVARGRTLEEEMAATPLLDADRIAELLLFLATEDGGCVVGPVFTE